MIPEQFSCCIIGNGSLIIPCGEYILENKGNILCVVTSEEDVITWCREQKIRVIPEEQCNELKHLSFDYLFSIVYLNLIPKEIISLPRKLAINYHDALLPVYAGIHATSWSIMNGEKLHGITWHIMQERLDTGNILVQKHVEIEEAETAVSLNLKCFHAAVEGFYELIDGIRSGCLKEFKQELHKRSYYGKWKKPSKAGLIDWYRTTDEIICFVNSLNFGEYENTLATAKIYFQETLYIVEGIEKGCEVFQGRPGIARRKQNQLLVLTKDSSVILHTIRTLTGKEIAISEIFGEADEIDLLGDTSITKKLEEEMNDTSKSEPYWIKKLLEAKETNSEFTYVLETEEQNFEHIELNLLEKTLFSIRHELQRAGKTEKYFIGYSNGKHRKDSLLADLVPLKLNLKDTLEETVIAELKEEICQLHANDTYVQDVYFRYETLKDQVFQPKIAIYIQGALPYSELERADVCFLLCEEEDTIDVLYSNSRYEHFIDNVIKKSGKRESKGMNKKDGQMQESFISTYQLICKQAKLHQNKIAIISSDDKITYEYLVNKVNKRAGTFHKMGIAKGMNIGVLLKRSYENIVSFLAIMKLGAVYIPMDSTYPQERLDYMAQNGEIEYLVTEATLPMKLSVGSFITIDIEQEKEEPFIETQTVELQPKDPVYILYTSGSTGKPKGVIVNHLGLSNFLLSMQQEPGFTADDKLLSVTTVCFDISGLEMYLPLISGGQVKIVPSETIHDGILLKEMVEASDATVIQATPATWNMLLMAGWENKLNIKILCGGENLSVELADKLLKSCNELWNMYGPTETTIWSTIKHIVDKNDITIGKPIKNTTIYILDKNNKQVSDSQVGELYIGGDGVANGYYKRDDITSERFIDNPVNPGELIYKTGDLVKRKDNGELVYLGRVDNQVKYHGFRIELEEIEKVIQEKLNLDKAVVVLRKDSLGEDALYAFVQSNVEINLDKDLSVLSEFLPHYMLPSEMIAVNSFPLTANKKINRKMLVSMSVEDIVDKFSGNTVKLEQEQLISSVPKENEGISEQKPVPALKETDKREAKPEYLPVIQKIAAEIVKRDAGEVEIDKNLSTYGYNSIRYTVLATKISKELNVKITPAICYTYKTIRELTQYISSINGAITPAERNQTATNQVQIDIRGLKEKLRAIVAEVIKKDIKAIQFEEPLSIYGVNSIRYTVLCTKINKELKTSITPAICYQYRTIKDLAEYLNKDSIRKNAPIKTETAAAIVKESVTETVVQKENELLKERQAENEQNEDVAIIGIGAHLPNADSLETIWNVLKNGKCVVGEIPEDRWDIKQYRQYDSKYPGYGAFMKDIWSFDPDFFQLTPREAVQIDPQQRLFLTTAWEAFEDAGYNPEEMAGSNIAVYVGTVESDYYNRLSRNIEQADIFTISGNIQCGIANRVSYMLDLKGESETINTACSSSLVAIDHAVKAIRNKECSLAIAGGVNVILNPFMHYALHKNGMLSPDGRCKAFDSEANGYVRGEGCCAILLKSLKEAERDKDHIYGVIKGSAINHDGRTNSFTAPNPVMQAELIKKAYKTAGIRPDYVSYIETHGTGTKLGDPIEINALKEGFERLYSEFELPKQHNYCAIGAVKANIGHLEAAAGIAGVIKILLCMQKGILPRVAGLKEVNPYIELDNSPFYILKENEKWSGIKDEKGNNRFIAGVSSFGFGGTNAHVVLEAYNKSEEVRQTRTSQGIFILSAKTREGLKRYAKALSEYVKRERALHGENNYENIAYTLQTGRKAYDFRVAFLAKDLKDLSMLLESYSSDKADSRIMEGNEVQNKAVNLLLEGSDGEEYITNLLKSNKLEKLGWLWVLGTDIDWNALYEEKRSKVSLPTYPFTKERNRLNSIDCFYDGSNAACEAVDRTVIRINPEEDYIKEHVINHNRVLPGIKYIDIAVKSCFENGQKVMHLRANEWLLPKIVTKEDRIEIETELCNGEIQYRLFSKKEAQTILYARGRAVTETDKRKEEAEHINIKQLKSSFTRRLTKEQIYNKYKELGYDYGIMFQPLEYVSYSGKEALSKIHITEEIRRKTENGTINISLFEGGMQAVIGCLYQEDFKQSFMPSCIKECYIYTTEVPEYAYGYARLVHHIQTEHGITKEFDIYITDELGNVMIKLLGYMLSSVFSKRDRIKDKTGIDSFLINKKWIEADIDTAKVETLSPIKILAINSESAGSKALLDKLNETAEVTRITQPDRNNTKRLGEMAADADIVLLFSDSSKGEDTLVYQQIVALSQTLFQKHFNGRMVYLFEEKDEFQCYEKAVEGFARCYQNETLQSVMKVIQTDDLKINLQAIISDILSDNNAYVIYRNGVRYIAQYEEAKTYQKGELIQTQNGVYIISGGTGQIGFRLAQRLTDRYPDIQIVLLSRNGLKEEQKKLFIGIDKQLHVIKADVSDYTQVEEAVEEIYEKYGTVKGVFHAAGTLEDCYIKDQADFCANKVLGPKIAGILNIDKVLKHQNIDFFVLFSSISAIIGNAGQSAYCYANSFLDSFAEFRNSLVEKKLRKGKTISINWGIWEDGGMKLSEAEMQSLWKRTGIAPIETEEGLSLLLDMDISKTENIGIVRADKAVLMDYINKTKLVHVDNSVRTVQSVSIEKPLMERLTDCLCKVIGIDRSKLVENKEFGDYGFDSLTNTAFADEINEKLDLDITPVTFFEYTTLGSLTTYLKEEYRDILEKHFAPQKVEAADEKQPESIKETVPDEKAQEETEDETEEEAEEYYTMTSDMPYVLAHTVFDEPVILGMTYIGHFCQSMRNKGIHIGEGSFKNVLFHEPVVVNRKEAVTFKTTYRRKNSTLALEESYEKMGKSITVATASYTTNTTANTVTEDWNFVINHADRVIDGEHIYAHKWKYDVKYSKVLQSVDKLYLKGDIAVGKLKLHSEISNMPYEVNPGLLDAAMICGLYAFLENVRESYIPYMIKSVWVNNTLTNECYCICKKNVCNDELLYMDITIIDEYGNILCIMKDFICKKVTLKAQFIKTHQEQLKEKYEAVYKEDIAVIGISASFAGSKTLEEYWDNLIQGRNLIGEIPSDHFEYQKYYDPDSKGDDKMYTKWGGFLNNVDKFDAPFFRISRREAQVMDPQLRLLLQHIYHAMEDAGYAGTIRGSKTGMYVGCCFHDYQQKMDRMGMPVSPHDATGNALTMLANRPSYYLDLKGPSVNVDTACSSSLVALHMACRGLIHKECDMAFAAGVNLLLDSWHYRYFCSIGALSKSGRCHTFSDQADGYIPGEGVAVVLLKPLQKAIEDHDNIYGVIKGSAINHGGLTSSITAPSISQEAQVIEDAWRDARVQAEDISYIEAHGTGTKLGDPIEINALKHVMNQQGKLSGQNCYIGSAKAHIGHTEGAAGLAGLIKVLLSMKHNTIPAMPYFDKLNPYIKLDQTNICINKESIKWSPSNGRKTAGISSFGAGGAYAHVVVEEYTAKRRESAIRKPRLIVLSAKSVDSLNRRCRELIDFIEKEKNQQAEEVFLKNLAYTLMVGREQLHVRLAFVVEDINTMLIRLKQYLDGNTSGIHFHVLDEDQLLSLTDMDCTMNLEQIAASWIQESNLDPHKPVGFEQEESGRISLPVYPFEEQAYWITEQKEPDLVYTVYPHDFYIKNHIIEQTKIMPAVAYLDYVIHAAPDTINKEGFSFMNVNFMAPLKITDNSQDIKIEFQKDSNDFVIKSRQEASELIHVQGSICTIMKLDEQFESIHEFDGLPNEILFTEFYEQLNQYGLHIGREFQSVQKLTYNNSKVKAYITLNNALANSFDSYILHPAVMDGILQAVISRDNKENLHIPFEIKAIHLVRRLQKDMIAYGSKDKLSGKWDITVTDREGCILLRIIGLLAKEVNNSYEKKRDDNIVHILEELSKGESTIKEVNERLEGLEGWS